MIREHGDAGSLVEAAEDLRAARRALEAVEAQTLSGVAETLARAVDRASDVLERLERMRPADWMDRQQVAAYLANRTKDSFDRIASEIPRHRLSEQRYLYNRAEVDEWLMSR